MTEWTLTLVTFCLLILSVKKAGFLPFPTGLILILGVSQVVFTLTHDNVIQFNMLAVFNYGGLHENFLTIHFLYTSIAAFSLISLTGKFKILKEIQTNIESIKNITNNKYLIYIIIISIIITISHLLLLFIIVDPDRLWFHKIYLSKITDNDSVKSLGLSLSSTTMRALPAVAIISSINFCVCLNSKKFLVLPIPGIISSIYYIILLSLHSRSSVLIPLIIGFNHIAIHKKFKKIIAIIFILISFFSLSSALEGRGKNEHGLSSIDDSISFFFSKEMPSQIITVITNFCEGIFSTAESFQINAKFSNRYKTLAFSPLPSLIDGYSSIRATSEHRLHLYVPMSGVGEVYLFGWPYCIILVIILFIAIRTHCYLVKHNPTSFLLCNFLILFSMDYILAYPIRNALRFIWIVLFTAMIVYIKSWLKTIPYQLNKNTPLAKPVD